MWMDVAEQIFGDISVVKKALHVISTRLRENPPRDHPQGNMGVYPPGGPFLLAGDTWTRRFVTGVSYGPENVSENRGLLQQRLETLVAEWYAEKEKYSDCLVESSKLLSDKEKAMEAMQMELAEAHISLCASSAKITLLLETNAVRHEEWVAERSQLQSLQEQLQPELQSRDTLVVSLQRELESSTKLIQQ
jgi:hypothetical protein